MIRSIKLNVQLEAIGRIVELSVQHQSQSSGLRASAGDEDRTEEGHYELDGIDLIEVDRAFTARSVPVEGTGTSRRQGQHEQRTIALNMPLGATGTPAA